MKELLAQEVSLQSIRDRKLSAQKAPVDSVQDQAMQVDRPPLQNTTTTKTNQADATKVLESTMEPLKPQTTVGKSTRRDEAAKTETVENDRPAKRQKVRKLFYRNTCPLFYFSISTASHLLFRRPKISWLWGQKDQNLLVARRAMLASPVRPTKSRIQEVAFHFNTSCA